MKSDIYSYVGSNRSKALSILRSFGYSPTNNNMASSLRSLVASEGEPALREIVDAHPDKDLILEMYNPKEGEHVSCNCNDCVMKEIKYLNADGFLNTHSKNTDSSKANKVQDNFSLIFLAGTMMIALAIMSK